ncbi:MAG: BON domain-containing protein [Acidobacteriaceae bacterium]
MRAETHHINQLIQRDRRFSSRRLTRQPIEFSLFREFSMTTYLRTVQRTMLAFAVLCAPMILLDTPAVAQSPTVQPDDSAQNKNPGQTADGQPNAKSDRLTTANVRKAIIADKGLSMYAHNVKIITRNGIVTLKGPVKSYEEKQQVDSDAASAVSQDKIVDHLTVKQ